MFGEDDIKSISYLKMNSAELVKKVNSRTEPIIITQNGEPQVVIQSIEEYKKKQDIINMLQIVSMGEQQIKEGRTIGLDEARKKLAIYLK